MRSALLAVLALAGCPSTSTGGGGGGIGGGPQPVNDGGIYPGQCTQDSDCNPAAGSGSDAGSGNGEVCASDGACVPASEVYIVHTTWTLNGQPASATTCSEAPDLVISFSSSSYGYSYGYAPVPCMEGEFTVEKLENYYNYVQLDPEAQNLGGSGATIPPTGGVVALDLPF